MRRWLQTASLAEDCRSTFDGVTVTVFFDTDPPLCKSSKDNVIVVPSDRNEQNNKRTWVAKVGQIKPRIETLEPPILPPSLPSYAANHPTT
jgi:hypothetical protein